MEERLKFDFVPFSLTQVIDAKGQCYTRHDNKMYLPQKLKSLLISNETPQEAIERAYYKPKPIERSQETQQPQNSLTLLPKS
jgi:hypothetical protein